MHLCTILLAVLALTGCQMATETSTRQTDSAAAHSPLPGRSAAPVTREEYLRQIKDRVSAGLATKGDFHGKTCDVEIFQPIGGPLIHAKAKPEGDAALCKAVMTTIIELDGNRNFPVNPAKETIRIMMDVQP